MEQTHPILSPDELRSQIATRLVSRRGERSISSAGESGVGHQIVARLEAAGDQNVDLGQLYRLARYYGCSLAGLIDPTRDEVGTWPEGRVPSEGATDRYVREQLRAQRQLHKLGTKELAKRSAELEAFLARSVPEDIAKVVRQRRADGERYVRIVRDLPIGIDQARQICSPGRPLVQQSWIVRIESGEVESLDAIRLYLMCAAMEVSIVDLLPPAFRTPA